MSRETQIPRQAQDTGIHTREVGIIPHLAFQRGDAALGAVVVLRAYATGAVVYRIGYVGTPGAVVPRVAFG